MITEDYVSFEIAKLLKEKGFDQNRDTYDCATYYWDGKIWHHHYGEIIREVIYAAPTQAMAMKWLRKEHNLCIVPLPVVTDDDGEGGCLWKYTISMKLKVLFDSENLYESPKIALDDAIKHCLENLI